MTYEARRRRLLRGSAAATSATFIAVAFHVIGGGALPNLMGLLVPLVLSHLVCTLLAGRHLSLWRLSISVVASQAIFHLLFSIFTGPAAPAPSTALERHLLHHGGHAGLGHGGLGHGGLGQAALSTSGMGHSGLGHGDHAGAGAAGVLTSAGGGHAGHAGHDHSSLPMLLAHLAAAALTVALIYWAEALLGKLRQCARLLIRVLLPAIPHSPAVPACPRLRLALGWIEPVRACLLRSPVVSRGPPVSAV